MRSTASPLKSQLKHFSRPVVRLTVAEGVRSSCSPVGQLTFTQPSRSGTVRSP
ncbi:MAG TPA: hypothetical protein VJ617_12150 [Arthrobacter sp.]|nr:hypothetical protein [Arthrobacter sp.]